MNRHFIIIFLSVLLLSSVANAQSSRSWEGGFELDVLPYATGGYFGAAWAGKNHTRLRILYAKVNMPDFIVKSGFTNNEIRSVAVVGDYFLDNEMKGLWLGAGFVLWDGSIQSDLQIETAKYQSFLLNGSGGYLFQLTNNLNVSPWLGMSLRIGGDKSIIVDSREYDPPVLNPELSFKVGWKF